MTLDMNAFQDDVIAASAARHGLSREAMVHAMTVGPSDVHIDAALSNLAVAYKPNRGRYIADLVMPVIPVAKRSDKYFKFAAGTFLDLNRTNIAGQMGMPAMVSYNLSNESYGVIDYGLRDFVPADVEGNADAPLRPLMDSTEVLAERLILAREYRVANVIGNTANYAANVSDLAGAGQWDNPLSDPVKAIEAAMLTPTVTPDTLVLGVQVWNVLKRHPAIERYILSRAATSLGATPLTVTPELVAQAFELKRVIVGSAKYNTAAPGATVSTSYLWGKFAALLAIEEAPAMQRTSTFGYTFRYAPNGVSPFETRTWYDYALGVRGGTWVKVTHSDIESIVGGSNAGFLFTHCIS